MEPASKIYGVHYSDEECQSSESGWTMYLGSRVDGENDHQNHSDAYQYDGKTHGYDHKDDSDDSMVSDASSGPSTHQKARAARVAKQEEKAKTKKHSAASATAKTRKEYNKPAEKKAKVKSSKAN